MPIEMKQVFGLRAFSARLRELGKERLQVEGRSDDAYSIAYLERRGFVEVDRWTRLVLDLDPHEPLGPVVPDGAASIDFQGPIL